MKSFFYQYVGQHQFVNFFTLIEKLKKFRNIKKNKKNLKQYINNGFVLFLNVTTCYIFFIKHFFSNSL